MINTTTLLQKLDSGKTMTTNELEYLEEDLREIVATLKGKGVMFKSTLDMCKYKIQDVNEILKARKENI